MGKRMKDDGRPRSSFDMREKEGRLFERLEAEEKTVVEQLETRFL